MDSFTGGGWNLFIIGCTLGGLLAMLLLTMACSRGTRPGGSTQDIEGRETTGHVWDEDLYELNNPLPRWWVVLFYATLLFSAVYLMLYPGLGSNSMILGWTQVGQYEEEMAEAEARYGPIFEQYLSQPIEEVATDPKALRIGERLYASYCAVCHGSDARGVRGFPNLRDDSWQWGGEPEQIAASIGDGRIAAMPGWKAALGGEAGVDEVSAYVLSLSGRSVDAAQAAAGEAKYRMFCVACHGAEGRGNPALGAPDFTDGVWLYGGTEAALRHSIGEGRFGRMPAHRDFLGEARVHVLAAWVYSLSRP